MHGVMCIEVCFQELEWCWLDTRRALVFFLSFRGCFMRVMNDSDEF